MSNKEVRKQIEKSFQKQADKVVVNRPAPQGNPPTNRTPAQPNQGNNRSVTGPLAQIKGDEDEKTTNSLKDSKANPSQQGSSKKNITLYLKY